jgi:archaellum component FlaC
METVITRDTDILREYLVALDARERGLSPFARLAATVKLARLRRELDVAQLDTTDEDIVALRHEIDERLDRTFARRFESRPWRARLSVFLMLILGQQLVLALVLVATLAFVRFAPVPKRWNPVLPHEDPAYLIAFIFFFFFVTPTLALLMLFGGRYFRSWRKTIPATLLIIALSALATFLVMRGREKNNPVRHLSSLSQFAKDRDLDVTNYRQWVDANWLMNDAKFQRDYENYLRNGPGRWVTSHVYAKSYEGDDAAWADALPIIEQYLAEGQDPEGFRDWLEYYFDRNRIYSEDRIDQEVDVLTGSANQRFLNIWEVEPYLKERDQRLYRAYLGSINQAMKWGALACLGLFTLVFLIIYLTGPALSFWERAAGTLRVRVRRGDKINLDSEQRAPSGRTARLRERYYSFPERSEITTPPFFDTPFQLLSRVHRSFVRLAVFTSILVFGFWAAVYALDLSAGHENMPSQIALMRSHLLFGGAADEGPDEAVGLIRRASAGRMQADPDQVVTTARTPGDIAYDSRLLAAATGERREQLLAARVVELEQQLDENDYQSGKKFKEQYQTIEAQQRTIGSLQVMAGQLQQTTTSLPQQLSELGSRTTAAEAGTGRVLGEVNAAREMAQGIEQQVNTKLKDIESRAARVADQVGKVEDQASALATRTEEFKEEISRRTREIEARTLELREQTESLKAREEQVNRFQRVAFAAILSEIKASADDLDRRVNSSFYRSFNKGEAQREADALRQRITAIMAELQDMNTDQAKQLIEQLGALSKRVDQIAARIK